MTRSAADSFRLLQEHYRAARALDADSRRDYVAELRTTEPEIATRLASMLDISDDRTELALPSVLTHADPIAPGDVVGGFAILEAIASGGMGTVFRARQEKPRRDVALKVMKGGLASDSARARFRLEAEILGSLSHDGIAAVHDAGVHGPADEIPWLAMELVDGVPLSRWIAREDPDLETRLRLLVEIARAVEHAHRRGVIHRDLKPANVLVTRDGKPKVIDFGVARARDAEIDLTTMETGEGVVVGTLAYMSPEQLSGDPRAVDTRTDVYALGVILHEMLTGTLPVDLRGLPLIDAIRLVTETVPRPLGEVERRYRGDIEVIVATALDHDKERRYGSATELADDIARHLANEPIAARPPSRTYRIKKFVRRNRLLVGSATVVALAVFAGIAGTGLAMKRANQRLEDKLAQERRHRRVVDFFYDTFKQVDAGTGYAPVTFEEFLRYMDRRLEKEDFGDDPLAEARIRSALGQAWVGSVAGEAARPHLERALALEKARSGGRTSAYADLLRTLARCDVVANATDEAEHALREALEIYREVGDLSGRIRTEYRLAQLADNLERDDEAREHLVTAIELSREGGAGFESLLATAIVEYGEEALGDEEHRAALAPLLDEAESAAVAVFGDRDSLLRAHVIEARARHREADGELVAAEDAARAARLMACRLFGDGGAARYLDPILLPRILSRGGRLDEAVADLQATIERLRDMPKHEFVLADCLAFLGRVHLRRGAFEDAATVLRASTARFAALFPDGSPPRTRALGLLADAYDRLARDAAASGDGETYDELRRIEIETRREGGLQKTSGYANAMLELGARLVVDGRLEEALGLFTEAMPVLRTTSGARLPVYTARRELQYAALLLELDDEDGAVRELVSAADRLARVGSSDVPDLAQAVREVKRLAEELDEPDGLEPFFEAFP